VSQKKTESYGEVVSKLESVVKRLEGGELSLEDSLQEFEEGIRLVRMGEKLLGAAERRVEQLLHDEQGEHAAPLEAPPARASSPGATSPEKAEDEDVPF
jgi:exodeoxyribonuclease VII small subunit